MRDPWFIRDPKNLDEIERDLRRFYPTLHVRREREVVVQGGFPVRHQHVPLDWFQVRIWLPPDYPDGIPAVRETGGRIPWTADRHVFTNGECCLFLPDARFRVWPVGASFLDFLNVPVHNYFVGQALVDRGEPWPLGELGHGARGVLQFYRDELGAEDDLVVAKFLLALAKPRFKGHWPCPCGSGRVLRKCHKELLFRLREVIPRSAALRSLALVLDEFEKRQKAS